VAVALLALAIACSKGSTSSGGATTPTPMPSPTPTPMPSTGTWTAEGARLTNAQVGFSGVLADTSSVQLTDGRWRMFYFAGNRYRSAISSDGLSFQVESGERLREGQGHIRVLRLDDGRVRAYFISRGGISSAISTDEGTTFTDEPGERINAMLAGASQISGGSIARTKDGRWRMYFSDLPIPGAGVVALRVFSAVSSDLLNWSLDPGVRLGTGATLSGSSEHPFALANTDGSISLFYFRNSNLTLMTSTSDDGLTFTTEGSTGITQANDPDIVRTGGSLRMYYNWGDDTSGTVFSATRAAGSMTFVPSMLPFRGGGPIAPGPIIRGPGSMTPAPVGRRGVSRGDIR
jgi:hypothetical protein